MCIQSFTNHNMGTTCRPKSYFKLNNATEELENNEEWQFRPMMDQGDRARCANIWCLSGV